MDTIIERNLAGPKIILTDHSKDRLSKRLGLSKRCHKKDAEKAFEYGLKHEETKGALRKYLNWLFLQHRTANNMRIFNQHVYIFIDNKLITVITLPHQYAETANRLLKAK